LPEAAPATAPATPATPAPPAPPAATPATPATPAPVALETFCPFEAVGAVIPASQGVSKGMALSMSGNAGANAAVAQVYAMGPKIWLNGDRVLKDKWIDISGNSNDADVTSGTISVDTQTAGANGCKAAFPFIKGDTSASLKLSRERGWPQDDKYTLFHVTRYDGSTRGRIWQGNGNAVNWLSGHHGGDAGCIYHGAWTVKKSASQRVQPEHWLLVTDQRGHQRSKRADSRTAWTRTLATSSADYKAYRHPKHLAINATDATVAKAEKSGFAVAEVVVFDRVLNREEVALVERYLELKYGF
jgi:hypothetical protein